MKIKNLSKKTLLADSCIAANTFFTRFVGLMGKKTLPEGKALIITPCNSIHMFFMRFPLDIVFLDKNNTVVHLIQSIKPWTISPVVRKAYSVIELPVGTIEASQTDVGDKLYIGF